MENQLIVLRDGELDPTYKRKRRIIKLKHGLQRISRAISRSLQPIVYEWELWSYDSRHNTHLRQEWLARKKRDREVAFRQVMGL